MKTNQAAGNAPIARLGFLRAYITTMRPYLMFVSGITGIAALSFAPTVSTGRAFLVASASFLSSGFGQALTDCFQTDTDSISAPYRPLTQGILSTRQVLAASITGLAGCVLVFSFCHPLNLILGAAAGLGLATYTPFKRRWWGGIFYNAWIVGVVFVMALLAGSGSATAVRSRHILLALGAVFFGYANFVLSGYFKDVEADRSTGYNTLPVVFGRKLSAWASDVIAILTVLPIILIAVPAHATFASAPSIFIVVGALALIIGQLRLHHVYSDSQAHRAIAPIVHGYCIAGGTSVADTACPVLCRLSAHYALQTNGTTDLRTP
jgi:4-hydroxybenzoate polyprenyltransferase